MVIVRRDVVPHMPTLIDDCVGNPTLPLVTIRCAPYHHEHSGACVILGDAAHAIVPFYGQGCNAAFEDVRILGGLLQGVTPATTATATTSTSASEASAAGGVSDGSSSGSDSNKVESRFRPVCEEFTRLRKRNADAIAELALEHYADMGVSTLSPLFLLRRSVRDKHSLSHLCPSPSIQWNQQHCLCFARPLTWAPDESCPVGGGCRMGLCCRCGGVS